MGFLLRTPYRPLRRRVKASVLLASLCFSGLLLYLGTVAIEILVVLYVLPLALIMMVLVFIILYIGSLIGEIVNGVMRPAVNAFLQIGPFFKDMLQPVIGLFLGYFLTIWVFALFYQSFYLYHTAALSVECKGSRTSNPLHFEDFLMFSMNTIAPVGISDTHPCWDPVRVLAYLEFVLGIGWTVIVFGALTAKLTDDWQGKKLEKFQKNLLADLKKNLLADNVSPQQTPETHGSDLEVGQPYFE